MPSLHDIKIIVYDGGRSHSGNIESVDGNRGTSKKDKKSKTLLQKVLNPTATANEQLQSQLSPTTYMAVSGAISIAKQTGRTLFNYYVSDIGRANGDSNYQAQINREIEKVTDVTNILGATASGAGMGAMVGGPIGAVVGGVIGLVSSGISNVAKYAERERAYAHEMFKQNNSQANLMARAGFNVLNGRVR